MGEVDERGVSNTASYSCRGPLPTYAMAATGWEALVAFPHPATYTFCTFVGRAPPPARNLPEPMDTQRRKEEQCSTRDASAVALLSKRVLVT